MTSDSNLGEMVGDDFYSHALVGRDGLWAFDGRHAQMISTHTPSWGVTETGWVGVYTGYISTHTPSWGVTVGYIFKQIGM